MIKEIAGVAVLVVGLYGISHAADAVKGKQVYDKKCAMCHGKDLKGNAAMAKTFKLEPKELSLAGEEIAEKTDAELIAITTKGEKKMPAYETKLTAEEIANSIAYIRAAASK